MQLCCQRLMTPLLATEAHCIFSSLVYRLPTVFVLLKPDDILLAGDDGPNPLDWAGSL